MNVHNTKTRKHTSITQHKSQHYTSVQYTTPHNMTLACIQHSTQTQQNTHTHRLDDLTKTHSQNHCPPQQQRGRKLQTMRRSGRMIRWEQKSRRLLARQRRAKGSKAITQNGRATAEGVQRAQRSRRNRREKQKEMAEKLGPAGMGEL